MVTRITATARLGKVIQYNEKKVAQGKANLLQAKNFLQDSNRLTLPEKLNRFQRLNERNGRSAVNTLHITLNFSPEETLTRSQLATIADRYMQGLHLDRQPYLVYEHKDAPHPHLHIVTSLIQPDGKRIPTHNIGVRLSEPTRQAIEQEFHLTPAKQKRPAFRDEQTTTQKIGRHLRSVNLSYYYASFEDYQAILRTYNIAASIGSPGSKTRQHGGLYYFSTDNQGRKNSPAIIASRLPGKPTLKHITQLIEQTPQPHPDELQSLRHRIDWARLQNPDSLRDQTEDLRLNGVDLVLRLSHPQAITTLTYVDHVHRNAIRADELGPAYSTATMLKEQLLHRHQQRESRPHKSPDINPDLTLDPAHSGSSLQLLSQLFRNPPNGPGDDLGQDLHPHQQQRPRR